MRPPELESDHERAIFGRHRLAPRGRIYTFGIRAQGIPLSPIETREFSRDHCRGIEHPAFLVDREGNGAEQFRQPAVDVPPRFIDLEQSIAAGDITLSEIQVVQRLRPDVRYAPL